VAVSVHQLLANGAGVQADLLRCKASGNHVGVVCSGPGTRGSLSSCTLEECAASGVSVSRGGAAMLQGCTVRWCVAAGIYAQHARTSVDLLDTSVTECTACGMDVSVMAQATLARCDLSSNGVSGLQVIVRHHADC
jgi:Right handed beta helix region